MKGLKVNVKKQEQMWDDVEVHKNEFGHLPDNRCGAHPLICNRQGYVCKHGIDHSKDSYCKKCLKDSIS